MTYLVTGLTPQERQAIATEIGIGSLQKYEAFISRDHGDGKTVYVNTSGSSDLQLFLDTLVQRGYAKLQGI